MSVLVLIFRDVLLSAIYDLGKGKVIRFLGPITRKRYKKAFERAVGRFYADPKYAGREARRQYKNYLAMLQDASKQEDILDSNGHVYQGMFDAFKQEVEEDSVLRINVLLNGLFITQKKIRKLNDKIDETIRSATTNREESKKEHQEICEQIKGLKDLINNPQMQSLTLAPIFGSAVMQNEQESHIIDRHQLVEKCIAALDNGKLLILYGALKVGKTTLAQMVAKRKEEVKIIDNVAEQDLDIKITYLLAAHEKGKIIVTTPVALNKNISTIDFSLIEQIEIPLLNKSETIDLIMTYKPMRDLSAFIYGHTCGHPVLVKTLCAHFSACEWKVDAGNFGQILSYSFDHDLKRVLSGLMGRLIIDDETRNLLNRLILVHGSFTEKEVHQLAEVEPQITEATRRLYSLVPSWVMNKGSEFKLSPLLNKLWRSDVSNVCQRQCNKILSQNILSLNKPLTEKDVLNYIIYSVNAGEYNNAGRMYITVLIKLYDNHHSLSQRSLLRSIWVDISLPEEMSLEIKIGFRLAQLLLLESLSQPKRHYLLWDVKQLVDGYKGNYKAFFYYAITLICLQEGDWEDGLKYDNMYNSLDKSEAVNVISQKGEPLSLCGNNIWLFLLLLKNVEEYETWLESFQKSHEDYSHDDKEVCNCCYLAILRLTKNYLRDSDIQTQQVVLERIQDKAERCGCPEVAIVCLFRLLDLFAIVGKHDKVKELYDIQYKKYKEHPLAVVLLNGALAYSCYINKKTCQENWCYFEQVLNFPDKELIPDIQLHIKELFAYVVAESNQKRCVELLNEALEYSNNENHRVNIFEYYQCKGELSYAYWCIGMREKAVELLSACLDFVLPLADEKKEFAKTYLCLCNCLITKYDADIHDKALPEKQFSPKHGMFTENNLMSLDKFFTDDRLYVSCYQMSDLCYGLNMNKLSYFWAKKTVDVCRKRGDVKEIHQLMFLLFPLLSMEEDIDDIAFILKHSDTAGRLMYQNHPELRNENHDIDYIRIQIVPLLMQALTMQIRGSDIGLELIKKNINDYVALSDEETINTIKNIFERTVYDRFFIAEINHLDIKKRHVVYLCAYMMTASHSNSDYAFDLLMAIIPTLQENLVEVYGIRIMNIINSYISSFWKERIHRNPEEFEGYDRLKTEGMRLIDENIGKLEQASKTMMVVSHHLKLPHKMDKNQEDWLYV